MFALVGCGGSSSTSGGSTGGNGGNGGAPGTPAGTYTVVVTATGSGSTAPTHSMNVTLIVN